MFKLKPHYTMYCDALLEISINKGNGWMSRQTFVSLTEFAIFWSNQELELITDTIYVTLK